MVSVSELKKSHFLRQNTVLFLGTLAVSVLNYTYYPILGRVLDLSTFGEVQVLIALFLQLLIFLSVLTQVTVTIVANYKDPVQRDRVIFELEKIAFLLSLVLLVLGTIFSAQLREVLNFHSSLPFIILLIALTITVPLTFRVAYLRGHKRFTSVSIAGIIGSAAKIFTSVGLVMLGFKTAGAIGGVVVAQILSLAYTAYQAHQLGFRRPSDAHYYSRPNFRILLPELKYTLFVLAASLGVVVLSSIDVLLVKYFFDAQTAGGYAGVATVAKIIFFLTASIGQVMLPSVKLEHPTKKNRQFLTKSFLLVAILGGSALLVFAVLPQLVVTILMGNSFTSYAYLLPMLSLSMFLMSIVNLVVLYCIALRKYQAGFVVVSGVALTIGLLITHHDSLLSIATQLVYGTSLLIVLFGLWRGGDYLVKRRKYV